MTPEEKQLLLKDLCARLPYGVMIKDTYSGHYGRLVEIGKTFAYFISELNSNTLDIQLCHIRPYLRPIKSMTPEECDKLFKILDIREDSGEWLKINDIGVLRLFTENGKDFYEIAKAMDYLYSIHVDFRGLIEKGLALEAPDNMYKMNRI